MFTVYLLCKLTSYVKNLAAFTSEISSYVYCITVILQQRRQPAFGVVLAKNRKSRPAQPQSHTRKPLLRPMKHARLFQNILGIPRMIKKPGNFGKSRACLEKALLFRQTTKT